MSDAWKHKMVVTTVGLWPSVGPHVPKALVAVAGGSALVPKHVVVGSPPYGRGTNRHCLWQEGNAASCRSLDGELVHI